MGGIYKFTNIYNGKIYIGQTTNFKRRQLQHLHNHKNPNDSGFNTKFYRALRKYGFDNFKFEIVEEIAYCEEILEHREVYWIDFYKSYENGYNSTRGANVTESFENHPNAKLSNEQVLEIKETLRLTKKSQYDLADSYGVSQAIISNINSGKKWMGLGDYSYPIRKDKKPKGECSPFSVLTAEMVMDMRNRYVSETARQIHSDYSDICSLVTIERALAGLTHSELPIYKKRLKKWIGKETCID